MSFATIHNHYTIWLPVSANIPHHKIPKLCFLRLLALAKSKFIYAFSTNEGSLGNAPGYEGLAPSANQELSYASDIFFAIYREFIPIIFLEDFFCQDVALLFFIHDP